MNRKIDIANFPEIDVFCEKNSFEAKLKLLESVDDLYRYKFTMQSNVATIPTAVHLRWRLPAENIKGVWRCGGVHDKRLRYDWELDHLQSRISVDAPVLCVFGYGDENVMTFACSDAVNLLEMNAVLREEDNFLYCHISFFTEPHPEITDYETEIRVDTRAVQFSEAIQTVTKWWEGFEVLKPCEVPVLAKAPLYSTWYNYHQSLEAESLLKECETAYKLGYELIILDDGWQTLDSNRGYDYTGDWQPNRFPDMAKFVEQVHQTGMKFGLWYSVPFCGKHSKAYQQFKGKFLTENHRWAPVFDPRYPEVRQYLIDTYTKALQSWNLDAFKLDFIDDFKVYPETILTKEDGRDFANVNEAVNKLLTDVMLSLKAIKPDIGIEFRQQYIGPALRKFGNMFRAFDCPNDPVSNRIRITDVKLLCGNTAVHSDMLTWHENEKVELAALQLLNSFFGVLQMSVLLNQLSEAHFKMVEFYTNYWKSNADVFMDGTFVAHSPLANYPYLSAAKNGKTIYGVYEDVVIQIDSTSSKIDILNGKASEYIIIKTNEKWNLNVLDCMGKVVEEKQLSNQQNIHYVEVPVGGIIQMTRL